MSDAVTRPPGMHDVARAAGVSHQTVSRVLNDHPQRPAGDEGARRAGHRRAGLPPQRRRPLARHATLRRDRGAHAPHPPVWADEHDDRRRGRSTRGGLLRQPGQRRRLVGGCARRRRRALQGPGSGGGRADRPGAGVARRCPHRRQRHAGRDDVRRLPRRQAVARVGGDGQPSRSSPRHQASARSRSHATSPSSPARRTRQRLRRGCGRGATR